MKPPVDSVEVVIVCVNNNRAADVVVAAAITRAFQVPNYAVQRDRLQLHAADAYWTAEQ